MERSKSLSGVILEPAQSTSLSHRSHEWNFLRVLEYFVPVVDRGMSYSQMPRAGLLRLTVTIERTILQLI